MVSDFALIYSEGDKAESLSIFSTTTFSSRCKVHDLDSLGSGFKSIVINSTVYLGYRVTFTIVILRIGHGFFVDQL